LDGPTGTNNLWDPASTWEGLDWLAAHTRLPLVVKGIMVGEDGRHATDHSARYLDTTLATIEALPEVVEVVAGRA
jgi:isopentenyl diphosphate isomerase/L-lactate dehydrogenase-like FMN-dependent dehydrogenase